MSTVQLVVDNIFIDLYEEDPIKLTYSIEDIRNNDTKSVFSRTFRVPATTHNFEFFSTAFEINGLDFDITQKYDAQILDNGALIVSGFFRITKIYRSEKTGKIDYECLFLGETRSFGSTLGDKMLTALDLSEYIHSFSLTEVVDSWQAYPEGGLNDGLFNGDILYPLIDFGTFYDANGVPPFNPIPGDPELYTDISGKPSTGTAGPHFDQNNQGLPAERFKPMIRTKALWDKIFEEAGYTYSSEFIESNRFRHLYTSAWNGSGEASIFNFVTGGGTFRAVMNGTHNAIGIQPYNSIQTGEGIGYNTSTGIYTVPTSINGIAVPPGTTFSFRWSASGSFNGDDFVGAEITGFLMHNGVAVDTDGPVSTTGNANQNYYFGSTNVDIVVNPGDQIYVEIQETAGSLQQFANVTGNILELKSALPATVQISTMLRDDYKQIDFIKDILTRFRLVMSPDKNDRNNFIIEPWVNYIGTGDYFDWTKKVDLNKDFVIEPLFFTQTEEIDFKDREDRDYLNQLNINEFGEVFGMLKVDSQNELLKGKRDVTTQTPPTPVSQILPGNQDPDGTTFIIPQVYVVEPGSQVNYILQKLPMSAHTRLLFYNGMKSTDSFSWRTSDNVSRTTFPMVSFYEDFPNTNATLNLNWQKETGYIQQDPVVSSPLSGQSCYEEYWSRYVDILYGKWSRRVTVYVELSSDDLREFSFDDLIFIKDTYYYVEKIYDVPVGQSALVKVDLIKLQDGINLGTQIPPDPPADGTPWNTAPENYNDEDEVWQIR